MVVFKPQSFESIPLRTMLWIRSGGSVINCPNGFVSVICFMDTDPDHLLKV
jgi:hypothetical protein